MNIVTLNSAQAQNKVVVIPLGDGPQKLGDNPDQSVTVGTTGPMVLRNTTIYPHSSSGPQDFGDNAGDDSYMMVNNDLDTESSGIFGNGDYTTIWNPGDLNSGAGLSAYLYILDEDRWSDDSNPYNGTALVAYLDTSGVWQVSDRNMKTNIQSFESALSKVKQMNAYSYDYKLNAKEVEKKQQPLSSIGLIAQEIKSIVPQAVSESASGQHFVNYSMIIPVLVTAIKEQQVLIEDMQARLDALEAQ